MGLQLEAVRQSVLTAGTKGLPTAGDGLRLEEIAAQGWSVLQESMPLPLACLRNDRLQHNARWMQQLMTAWGVDLVPHGKTTMCPQLFDRQLAQGAWGITVANVQQLKVCRQVGVQRVLMANQLVCIDDIHYVASCLDDDAFELIVLIDSQAGVDRLQQSLQQQGAPRPLNVLVELGVTGGRTGCRSADEVVALATYAAQQPLLSVVGLECYEGILVSDQPEDDEQRIQQWVAELVAALEGCAQANVFAANDEVMLSAGGSAYFDLVAQQLSPAFSRTLQGLSQSLRTLVRSGCYLTHDSVFYQRMFERLRERTELPLPEGEGLQPALEVWACVQSVPEPGLAIINAGKRDLSYDLDLPRPQQWFRSGAMTQPAVFSEGCATISQLSDQHAFLRFDETVDLQVGDRVALGISHPCTTFDKWQLLYLVDEDYQVVDAVKTFF